MLECDYNNFQHRLDMLSFILRKILNILAAKYPKAV